VPGRENNTAYWEKHKHLRKATTKKLLKSVSVYAYRKKLQINIKFIRYQSANIANYWLPAVFLVVVFNINGFATLTHRFSSNAWF
jgi:hypothetical protein